MDIDYIIVQAGGKGTRLGKLTKNKPKALCPVENLPILFHLFKKFPDKKFIIIGDYQYQVLEGYLKSFATVDYSMVRAEGAGTCGGIQKALQYVPVDRPFMLIWCDLILGEEFGLDELMQSDYIGISKGFSCRWSYRDGTFSEEPSKDCGVAGLFLFNKKDKLNNVPSEGEFVKWLKEKNLKFLVLPMEDAREFGSLADFQKEDKMEYRSRPFNKLTIDGDLVIKYPISEQGESLARREEQWYREIEGYGFKQVPKIYNFSPLTMEKIDGVTIFKAKLSQEEKKRVLYNLVASLKKLHDLKECPVEIDSVNEAYFEKTMKRLESVKHLIPLADREYIRINDKLCRNIFYFKKDFRQQIEDLLYDTRFVLIHGDCTFSNTLIDRELNVTFIDPRGYFGHTELCGDVYYDWAKVYYSIYGDYDQFNNKNFDLTIKEDWVLLRIETSGWKDLTDFYLSQIEKCDIKKIKLIHAIIWLSLSTYVWEDYDSICGAFYNGLYYFNENMEKSLHRVLEKTCRSAKNLLGH